MVRVDDDDDDDVDGEEEGRGRKRVLENSQSLAEDKEAGVWGYCTVDSCR
jgi:hypothetical protein